MSTEEHSESRTHSHTASVHMAPSAQAVLKAGLEELLGLTESVRPEPLPSARYPFPLCSAVYGGRPDIHSVREEVGEHLNDDPLSALEPALVLLEFYQASRPETADAVPGDEEFLGRAFRTKRRNGWMAVLGDGREAELQDAVNEKWQFEFLPATGRWTPLYVLLNMLARYGFVYGRIEPGDPHALGHFIEDFGPGLLACRGELDDADLALSLAAMKLGVPALVPPDYPFELGRRVEADSLQQVTDSVAAFPNIRRLLDVPDIPSLPPYLEPGSEEEEFQAARTWGDTPDSFYLLRKGTVESTGVEVCGRPAGPLGVIVTVDAEPMDAFDRRYIGARAARTLSMLPGVRPSRSNGRLVLELAEGVECPAERVGETLVAAIRHEFPKIEKVRAEIIFDTDRLAAEQERVREERERRRAEIEKATEESLDRFVTCIGCSPFAPDHVCILTPERPPQCGRSYESIKTGALYGYDDMSNIHHRRMHSGVNSFGTCEKGERLNPQAGEWSGVNQAAAELTGGRTTRVQLHSLREAPTTGCGCFRMVMFETEQPRPGVAIMDRTYEGAAPDGRTWQDLHYALGGKQTPGMAGCSAAYLASPRFLAAHGGWDAVVWVSPKVASIAGDRLPEHVVVGE